MVDWNPSGLYTRVVTYFCFFAGEGFSENSRRQDCTIGQVNHTHKLDQLVTDSNKLYCDVGCLKYLKCSFSFHKLHSGDFKILMRENADGLTTHLSLFVLWLS